MRGISNVELMPDGSEREIASRLRHSLASSRSLRAAVAYWCIGIDELGAELVARLSGDGFLCVDIHLPTDIDRLAEMVSAGANVYLHLQDPNPQPGELKMKLPPHLLHTKMLLFERDSDPSELWVGSHNWTARALTGVNIEASLRVMLDETATLHQQASHFLNDIRSLCVPFDVTAIDYYKWLQDQANEEQVWVLEVCGSHSTLYSAGKLTIFGSSDQDYKNLKSVDKSIVISLFDDISKQEYLYEATIHDTGRLNGAGVDFDSRLFAVHQLAGRPNLQGPSVPPLSVLASAKSWATVEIIGDLVGATFEVPPPDRWLPPSRDNAGLRSVNFRKWFKDPDRPLVRDPVPREVYEGRKAGTPQIGRDRENKGADSLQVSRAGEGLIRKKLVRAKRASGEVFRLTKPGRRQDKDRDQK
jgi:hypothetical protein